MTSRIWSREDIRNILLAIYAAKVPPLEAGSPATELPPPERSYLWGCRAAVQALLLAFGLPLQLLDRAIQQPAPSGEAAHGSTEHWWLQDLENVVAAVYRSTLSAPIHDLDLAHVQHYQRGFGDVVDAMLKALGSTKNPQRWFRQVLTERRWILAEEEDTPPRWVGSPPDEANPPQG